MKKLVILAFVLVLLVSCKTLSGSKVSAFSGSESIDDPQAFIAIAIEGNANTFSIEGADPENEELKYTFKGTTDGLPQLFAVEPGRYNILSVGVGGRYIDAQEKSYSSESIFKDTFEVYAGEVLYMGDYRFFYRSDFNSSSWGLKDVKNTFKSTSAYIKENYEAVADYKFVCTLRISETMNVKFLDDGEFAVDVINDLESENTLAVSPYFTSLLVSDLLVTLNLHNKLEESELEAFIESFFTGLPKKQEEPDNVIVAYLNGFFGDGSALEMQISTFEIKAEFTKANTLYGLLISTNIDPSKDDGAGGFTGPSEATNAFLAQYTNFQQVFIVTMGGGIIKPENYLPNDVYEEQLAVSTDFDRFNLTDLMLKDDRKDNDEEAKAILEDLIANSSDQMIKDASLLNLHLYYLSQGQTDEALITMLKAKSSSSPEVVQEAVVYSAFKWPIINTVYKVHDASL